MSAIKIREALVDDMAAILALYAQPAYDDGEVIDIAGAQDIFRRTSAYPYYHFFVAESGDAIVGTFALMVMDNIGHLGSRSAIVESVAVAAQCQGMGIGRQMMRHAMDEAREQGCYKLALSSNLKRTRAHAFYNKLGFEQHGVSYRIALQDGAAS